MHNSDEGYWLTPCLPRGTVPQSPPMHVPGLSPGPDPRPCARPPSRAQEAPPCVRGTCRAAHVLGGITVAWSSSAASPWSTTALPALRHANTQHALAQQSLPAERHSPGCGNAKMRRMAAGRGGRGPPPAGAPRAQGSPCQGDPHRWSIGLRPRPAPHQAACIDQDAL